MAVFRSHEGNKSSIVSSDSLYGKAIDSDAGGFSRRRRAVYSPICRGAYPDVSPPMVETITHGPDTRRKRWSIIALPTEVEMNGVPKLDVMRSISLYSLLDVICHLMETRMNTVRQLVGQRFSDITYPSGVTPWLAPLSSPSGLVYRYVLDSPDRSAQELQSYEDPVLST